MILPSRLAHTTLGDVLGQCHRERASGALVLVEPQGRTHRIYMQSGLCTAVELYRASPPLMEILRELDGAPDAATLRRSLLRSLSSTRLHGEVLVQDFAVSPSVISLALRRQIQARLTALESLRDASLRFTVIEPAPRHALTDTPLGSAEFLHGRRRARDAEAPAEWSRAPRCTQTSEARRVLGIDEEADEHEVKRAYRKLVRALHPDLNPTATAEERSAQNHRFAIATAAYRALTG